MSQLVNTDPLLSYAFCSTALPHSLPFGSNSSPFPPSNAVPMGKEVDHYLSYLKRVKYMRKPYALVSRITKKSLQLSDEKKE